MFKIALDAGHGLYTAGKRCLKSIDPKETREWSLNSRIAEKVTEKLKEYTEYELLRVDDTTGKTDVALKTRTDKANKWGADFYLSIHHNAGINGGSGGGIAVYTYIDVDKTTKDWQKAIYDSLIKLTGLKGNRSQPLAQADLHVCRETSMPAVLIENGFMDSTSDTPIILTDDFADKSAEAIVEVLAEKGGLKRAEREVYYLVKKSWKAETAYRTKYISQARIYAREHHYVIYDENGKTITSYREDEPYYLVKKSWKAETVYRTKYISQARIIARKYNYVIYDENGKTIYSYR